MVSFNDFSKLDLRVGRVLEVKDHPNASKLYVLSVDIGQRVVQLVAGLKPYYQPLELKDKRIVVLTNLEPKNLRGLESEGMLLAAQSQDTISVIGPDREVEPGSIIK